MSYELYEREMESLRYRNEPQELCALGYRIETETRNFELSTRCYKMSCDMDYPSGYYWYGMALLNGKGVEKSVDEGLKYIQLAAKMLQVDAIVAFYNFYDKGNYVREDKDISQLFLTLYKKIKETDKLMDLYAITGTLDGQQRRLETSRLLNEAINNFNETNNHPFDINEYQP